MTFELHAPPISLLALLSMILFFAVIGHAATVALLKYLIRGIFLAAGFIVGLFVFVWVIEFLAGRS